MMGSIKHAISRLAVTAALCAGAPTQAHAQYRDAPANNGLAEIIFPASRRAEGLQKTAISVSALNADALTARSVQSVEQIAALVPGVQIATYQGDTSIFIRGIGTPVIIAGNDSSTAAYVNGIFLSRAAAIGPSFFDVDRIEVLRGPQGTLYGRNATGGSVNILTKRPTEDFSAEGRLILGNYERVQAFGAVSGPITDTVRARFATQYENRGGYTTVNLARGALPPTQDDLSFDAEDRNDIAMRLTVEADVSENAVLTVMADYFHANDRANVFHFASAGYAEEVPNWYESREGSQTLPYFAIKNSGRVTERKSRDIFAAVPFRNDTEIWGINAQLDWSIGEYDLQVITGYKESNPDFQNTFDLGDTFNTYYRRAEDHWQYTADFQLSSPQGKRFSWIVGGGYFTEENVINNDIFGDFWEPILIQGFADLQDAGVIPVFPIDIPSTNLCCELRLNGGQETQAFNVYVDATYEITDTLALKIGGRYTRERRDGFQNFDLVFLSPEGGDARVPFAPNPMLFPNAISDDRDNVVPDPLGFVIAPVAGPTTFDAFTPKFALEWSPNVNVLAYASVQRGFKSGGYNIGSSQREAFEPETIWSYELGVKSQLLDNRLRVNAAAFYYDYTNLQAQDSIGNQPIIRNVGAAEVLGFEVEAAAILSEYFSLDGSVTYLDAQFTEGTLTEPLRPAPLDQEPGSLVRDLDGLRLPRAPEWKFNIGAVFNYPMDEKGDLSLRIDYGWQSKIFFTVFNIDAASEDSFGLLKARASWTSEDGGYSVAIFGDNLTDEAYFTNQILTGTVYGAEFVGPLAPPRTWGVEFNAKF
ncbi:MAG: TonB-dependent receptor [Pseudomonadota bacterium]